MSLGGRQFGLPEGDSLISRRETNVVSRRETKVVSRRETNVVSRRETNIVSRSETVWSPGGRQFGLP